MVDLADILAGYRQRKRENGSAASHRWFPKRNRPQQQRARDQKAEATKLRAKRTPERPLSNLPDLQSKVEELQGRLQHAREAKDQCEGIDREKGKERNDAKKRFDSLQGEMNRMQENFNRLDSVGKGNPLARFGNDVPKNGEDVSPWKGFHWPCWCLYQN